MIIQKIKKKTEYTTSFLFLYFSGVFMFFVISKNISSSFSLSSPVVFFVSFLPPYSLYLSTPLILSSFFFHFLSSIFHLLRSLSHVFSFTYPSFHFFPFLFFHFSFIPYFLPIVFQSYISFHIIFLTSTRPSSFSIYFIPSVFNFTIFNPNALDVRNFDTRHGISVSKLRGKIIDGNCTETRYTHISVCICMFEYKCISRLLRNSMIPTSVSLVKT